MGILSLWIYLPFIAVFLCGQEDLVIGGHAIQGDPKSISFLDPLPEDCADKEPTQPVYWYVMIRQASHIDHSF